MAIAHTLMREHMSIVNARQFSPERTDVTLEMALDAIGADFVELLVADDEDGLWQIDNDVTIPANVNLHIPLGVTLVGPGDVTILGGLSALRWPVHLGPGVIVWDNATLGPTFSTLHVGALNVEHGTFTDIVIENSFVLGHPEAGPPQPPGPVPFPPFTATDFSMVAYNSTDTGGEVSASGTFLGWQYTHLTSNTDVQSSSVALQGSPQLNLNGYHFTGAMRGLIVNPLVYSATGGIIDTCQGLSTGIQAQGSATVTEGDGITIYGPSATDTGTIVTYRGLQCGNIPATAKVTNIFQIFTQLDASEDQATKPRYNLYLEGGAPSYIAGHLGIAGLPTTAMLFVNGTATKPAGGSWADSASSILLKQHVRPIPDALGTLLQLQGRQWEWGTDQEELERLLPGTQTGLVIEEVELVLPGWVLHGDDGSLALQERGVTAYVVESFREVVAMIQGLTQRVKTLETP